LSRGDELNYGRLKIATGSWLYAPIAGAELTGIYNFKSLSTAERLVSKI
jgi:hypothetical protein